MIYAIIRIFATEKHENSTELRRLFVTGSTKVHVLFVQKQSEIQPTEPIRELKSSDIHWVCRYSAVDTVCHTFDALLATLKEIVDSDDHKKNLQRQKLYHSSPTHHP